MASLAVAAGSNGSGGKAEGRRAKRVSAWGWGPMRNQEMQADMTDRTSRRAFMTTAGGGLLASTVAAGFPSIVPASVLGANAPSNQINIGAIGTGGISRVHEPPGSLRYDTAPIMAVCALDSNRVADAKTLINGQYAKKTGRPYDGVA